MGLGNILLLTQATCYTLTLVLSVCTVVPTAVHVHNFAGRCLLYTTGTFDSDDGHFIARWASPFYCLFTLAVGGLMLVVSLVQLVRMSVFLYKGCDSSFLSAFLDSVVSILVMLLVFITSVLVSDGFRTWCRAITQRFPAQVLASVTISKPDNVDTVGFYMHVGTAQFGAWSSWVCWVLQAVLCTRKLCLYHERENLMISMARERRLLNASLEQSGSQCVEDTVPILD
ncbi:transmembrane protein, putative [Ixodes scapularis]|uniref:Transmembrane protein, putative n=1 Tax=Ixodes scapularis TaxID=6945 RepID=B7QNV7_IXOSC|nr:transmembrane protein, putative [Ixodes scapularis]|eukprot:XP_002416612.1 transmembrane protein, putative [Ixodes scapularis]